MQELWGYDANGLRTFKTVNGATTSYQYMNGRLTRAGNTHYYYHQDGRPAYMNYSGKDYYFMLDGMGSVIGLFDPIEWEVVAGYSYDEWGKPLSTPTGLAAANVLRYRGYAYDQETGLYYLQSRYYDPEKGRFLNADGVVLDGPSLIETNAFMYCNNNPGRYADYRGNRALCSGCAANGSCPGHFQPTQREKDAYIPPMPEVILHDFNHSNGSLTWSGTVTQYYNTDSLRSQGTNKLHYEAEKKAAEAFIGPYYKESFINSNVYLGTGATGYKGVLDLGTFSMSAGIGTSDEFLIGVKGVAKFSVVSGRATITLWDVEIGLSADALSVSVSGHFGISESGLSFQTPTLGASGASLGFIVRKVR